MNRAAKKKRFDPVAFAWAVLATLLFFGVVYLYIIEIKYFNLYLNVGSMLLRGVLIGSVLGFLLGWVAGLKEEIPFDRVRLALLFMLAGLILVPISISLSNRYLDKNPVINERVEIHSIKPFVDPAFNRIPGQQPKVKYYDIVFMKDGVTYTAFPPFLPEGAQVGRDVTLPIHKGFWGYQWLDLGH